MSSDRDATPAESRPDLGVDASDGFGDRYRIEPREDVLDEGVSACTRTAPRSMHTVQKLAHRDHADCAFLGTDELVEFG